MKTAPTRPSVKPLDFLDTTNAGAGDWLCYTNDGTMPGCGNAAQTCTGPTAIVLAASPWAAPVTTTGITLKTALEREGFTSVRRRETNPDLDQCSWARGTLYVEAVKS